MARILTEGFELADRVRTGGTSIQSGAPFEGYYLRCNNGTGATLDLPSAISEGYFRMRATWNGLTTNLVALTNSGTGINSLVHSGGTLQVRVGSTTVGTSSSLGSGNSNIRLIELYFKVADSGGRLILKVDGVEEVNFTGDTKPGAPTTVNRIIFYSNANGAAYYTQFDDVAVNDTTGTINNSWCGPGRVIALVPTDAGDVTQLTPSTEANWQCVDDRPNNGDTDYVSSATANAYDLYNVTNFPLTDKLIRVAYVEARAKDTAALSKPVSLGVKIGGTEHWSSDVPLAVTYTAVVGPQLDTNPTSGQPWTIDNINDIQIGVKVK